MDIKKAASMIGRMGGEANAKKQSTAHFRSLGENVWKGISKEERSKIMKARSKKREENKKKLSTT